MPDPTLSLPGESESPTRPGTGDRRALPRQRSSCGWPVRLLARPSFRAYRALLRDVSFRGIGLLVEESLDVGTMLAVQLRSKHTQVSGILTATVRHATPLPDGTCVVGCSLNRPLTDEEIQALMG